MASAIAIFFVSLWAAFRGEYEQAIYAILVCISFELGYIAIRKWTSQ